MSEKWKRYLTDALIISPALIVLILSAFLQLMMTSLGSDLKNLGPVLMSCAAFVSLAASLLMGTVYRRHFVTAFHTVICAVCFIGCIVSMTAAAPADGLGAVLLIISVFPSSGYMAFFYSSSSPDMVQCFLAFAALLMCVIFCAAEKHLEKRDADG